MYSPRALNRFMEKGLASMRRSFVQRSRWFYPLQFLPVNLFGAVMGIAGLSLAWRSSAALFGTSNLVSEVIGWLAITIFITLSIAYLIKWLFFAKKVKEEFSNPIVMNFFGTIPISILLLSAVLKTWNFAFAEMIWVIGLVLSIVLAWIIVDRLLKNRQDLLHATPAWLIPGVGTLDIVVTGGNMPFLWATEINVFAFAVGSVLALVFFTLIFSRLMHHDPMPEKLTPSLIILIAPFEVGFLAYTNINEIDLFASILFYFGLFLFTIVFLKVFRKKFPFMISWWAVGFPIAALSNAALKYALYANTILLRWIAGILLFVLTLLIIFILIRTLKLLFTGKLLSA